MGSGGVGGVPPQPPANICDPSGVELPDAGEHAGRVELPCTPAGVKDISRGLRAYPPDTPGTDDNSVPDPGGVTDGHAENARINPPAFNLDTLLHDVGASNLDDWLRNKFFEEHYKLFHHRPFIWHIWDGRKDGFNALVNYHKLDFKLLEKLAYTYLGDWIKRQEDALKQGASGADDRLLKARELQKKLALILTGDCAPDKQSGHDIFVRWKKLEAQPAGWHPDLNDGVRLNIRPFMTADVPRKRPNIKWGVDRGKNPPGAPWGEERDNDRHLGLKEKNDAKQKK